MWQQLTMLFAKPFERFDRILAYFGGGFLVVAALLLAMPPSELCRITARVTGLPAGVAPEPELIRMQVERLQMSEPLQAERERWIAFALEHARQQAGLRAVDAGECWYYWSESQRTTLGLVLLLAAALFGPLGSALGAPLEWLTDVGINRMVRFFSMCCADSIRPQPDYIEVALRCPHWFEAALLASGLAGREQKSLSLYENLEILVRNAMVSLLVIFPFCLVSFLAECSVVALVVVVVVVVGFVLAAVAGWLLTRVRLRMLFSHLLYRAARLDGLPELVGPDGNLPADFDQNPAKWFRKLVRRLPEPEKDRQK